MYLFLFKFLNGVSTKNAAKPAYKRTSESVIYSALPLFATWKQFFFDRNYFKM